MVPVFFKGKIVSVVAVANRATGYTELDAKDLTAFCEAIQEIIERKKLEGALIIQNELYMQLVDSHPAGIYRVRIFPPTKWEKNAWDSSKSAPYVMELVSGRFCEILGIDKDVYSRNPSILNDLISSEDKASAQVMEGRHPERPQAFLGKPYRKEQLCQAIWQALG